MPTGGIDLGIGAALTSEIGATAAGITTGALEGAGLGAAVSGITGGNPLKGALGGAITGGFIPIGGDLLGSSIGTTAADALGGVAGGALSSAITGGNPLVGAAEGGLGGAITGALSPSAASPGTAPSAGGTAVSGAGASAGSAAPPSVVGYDPLSSISVPNALTASSPASILPSDVTGTPALPSPGTPAAPSVTPPTIGTTGTGNYIDNLTAPLGPSPGSTGYQGFGQAAETSNLNTNIPTVTNQAGPNDALITGQTGANIGSPHVMDLTAGTPAAAPAPGLVQQGLEGLGVGNKTAGIIASAAPYLPAAGALGLDLIRGEQTPKGLNALESQAQTLTSESKTLQGYLTSGTLPPGVQQSLDSAANSAKTAIKAQFAARGMSGSSSEAEALANVDATMAGQGANIAIELLQQGVSEGNIASQLYQTIMNTSISENNQLGSAIGNFAGALASGGSGGQTVTIKAA